jgi:hypothetical protein
MALVSTTRSLFLEKPVEIVVGLLMLCIGIGLPIVFQEQILGFVGSALSGAAGILLSWSASAIHNTKKAAELLRPQLEAISRHLGTISSNIAKVGIDAENDIISPETAFALTRQCSATLYGLVNDLQVLSGTKFDSATIMDTVQRIDEMAHKVSQSASESKRKNESADFSIDVEKLQTEIHNLRTQITGSFIGETSNKLVTEKVQCPYCQQLTKVVIGRHVGSTARNTCQQCSESFNTHRSGEDVFARPDYAHPLITNYISNTDKYKKLLSDQGLRLVAQPLRGAILNSAVRAFSGGKFFGKWEDLQRDISEDLEQRGYDVDQTAVLKVRHLMYRSRLFVLRPEGGIGLKPDIKQDNISNLVDQNIVNRFVQIFGINFDRHATMEILTGKSQSDHGYIDALIKNQSEPNLE